MVPLPSTDQPLALRGRWVVPVDRPPMDGGVVTITQGRILAVGENLSAEAPHDLGEVALLPGLVNAHTHLEFSLLNRPLRTPGMPFSQWIGEVIGWRARLQQEHSEEELHCYREGAIAAGQLESASSGVVAIGEIARLDVPVKGYARESPIAARLFGELIGLAAERVEPLVQRADDYLMGLSGADGDLYCGISPPAPMHVSH